LTAGCVLNQAEAESLAKRPGWKASWLGEVLGIERKAIAEQVEGKKLDDGKLRYDLVQNDAKAEFVAVLSFEAVKYDPDNWRLVPDLERRYFAALRRHLRAVRKGELLDPETGLHHLAAAECCVHFLLGKSLEDNPELVASFEERFKASLETARKIRASR